MDDFVERLFLRNHANIKQEIMNKPGVYQVHTGVFGPTDIQVYGPIAARRQEFILGIRQIPQIVEARKPRRLHLFSTDKLRLDGGAEAKRNLVRLQRKLDGMVHFGVRWQTSTIYL